MQRRKVRLSEQSLKDLLSIAEYTFEQWGEAQQYTYMMLVDRAIGRLGEYPEYGRRRDELGVGIRSIPCERHVIYYRIEDQTVSVVRVQHHAEEPELDN
jgi:toxin ParE1/3/4